jgi:tRNA modification GTPase
LSQNPDIIAAIATGPGNGGVGVVRISGNCLTEIMLSLVGKELVPRYATLTEFLDSDGTVIDHGIAIYYPNPKSYTGEDVLELQGHGGSVVLKLLLRSCLAAGARMAHPGEFTQRAYLNNKLDLVQAESIADIINATNEQAVRSATRSLEGEFSRVINKLISALIDLRIRIEAGLDFPEEEIDLDEKEYYEFKLQSILENLEEVFQSAKQGSVLRSGAQIALVGRPNVGKSSLLNCLAGDEIAIVSDLAGTTRDAIHQEISIQGMPFTFIDTAGLRDTKDVVELLGMKRTKEVIKKADIVFIIKDAQNELDPEISKVIDLIPSNISKIYIINKIDLLKELPRIEEINGDKYIFLSAKTKNGIDLLQNIILKKFNWNTESNVFMARERHLQALKGAKHFLKRAEGEINRLELFAEELRLAQDSLAQILGEFTSDDLLGEIFSRFCIGK